MSIKKVNTGADSTVTQFAKFSFKLADTKPKDEKLTKQEYEALFADSVSVSERRSRTDKFWAENDGNKNGTIELPELIRGFQRDSQP